MRKLIIVNACSVLRDAQVKAKVKPLQTQIDRDFYPVWQHRVEPVTVSFAPIDGIPELPPDCWPIFLNRHSNEDDALGWHDDDPSQNIRTYSRVFVGDCIHLELDWGVTLSHEALELVLDPNIKRVYRMRNGRLAALEACDAVEADAQAYPVARHYVSNFVLPAYFSANEPGPFDYGNVLKGRCPTLTDGGYMSVTDASGQWTQVARDRHDGLKGRRALLAGHRRQMRARLPMNALEEIGREETA